MPDLATLAAQGMLAERPRAVAPAGRREDPQALARAAHEFEAWFVQSWLQQASRAPLGDGEGPLSGGRAGRIYREEWQRELSRAATAGRGIGFADAITRSVLRVRENAAPEATR